MTTNGNTAIELYEEKSAHQHWVLALGQKIIVSKEKKLPMGIIIPEDMSEEEVLLLGQTIAEFGKAAPFYVGDYLLGVQQNYGSMYSQAEAIFDLDYFTLARRKSVAKAFSPTTRERFPTLTYGHFQEVAGMPREHAIALLAKASSEGLTCSKVRRLVEIYNKKKGKPNPSDNDDSRSQLKSSGSAFNFSIQRTQKKCTPEEVHVVTEKIVNEMLESGKLRSGDLIEVVIDFYTVELAEDEPAEQ